jgi:uncharacterized protein (TIGR01777 family)
MQQASDGMDRGTVVIAGGTGFLGRNLAEYLITAGYAVVVLGRHEPRPVPGVTFEPWDARTLGNWAQHLEDATALVNLAGRSVDCIKTPEHCDEILRSRVEATRVLGEALSRISKPPTVWVQMGTAHIYGDPPVAICDENSAFGYGLAPTVGKAWEEAFRSGKPPGTRGVVLRTSFVLGRPGGALDRLGLLARLGLGGTIGHGRQGISWLHIHDMNRLFLHAIQNPDVSGIYNATAPTPVSNREFMRELRRAIGMPIGLPAPAFGVRLAAPLFLRTDPELALYGRYVIPKRLTDEGFTFEYPDLNAALAQLYR